MADEKITALPLLAVPVAADLMEVVDDPAGAPVSSRATIGTIVEAGMVDIGARVYNSGNISVPASAWTVLTFDSERYDTDTIHSTIANTERLTATTAGKYLIGGQVSFASDATGNVRAIRIYLNGVTPIALLMLPTGLGGGFPQVLVVNTTYNLSATDYVELYAYQDTAGALNALAAANHAPEFMMQKIG